jgi:hypothetical protein
MGEFLGKHKKASVLVATGIILLLYFALRPTASVRGERDALLDLAHGHYVELVYGLPVKWAPEYKQCLRQRCGVEARTVAGDVLTESEVSYFRSYSAVSTAAIKQKFGRDVFDVCADLARKSSRSKNATAKGN